MKDLVKGKRIVVTGSSSGIGLETARILTEQGAEVLGIDVNHFSVQAHAAAINLQHELGAVPQ